MKNVLVKLLACLVVLTMVFSVVACGGKDADTNKDDGKDDAANDSGDSNNDTSVDDPFGDEWGDGNEFGEEEDPGDEEDEMKEIMEQLWAQIKTYSVPNSKATVKGLLTTDRIGKFVASNGAFTAEPADGKALAEITNVKTANGVKSVKIEYEYTASTLGDNGIIFAANPAKDATTWGWEDMPYYFAFVDVNGTARIAKVDPAATNVWTNVAEKPANVAANSKVKVVIEWNGASAIKLTVNGVTVEGTAELANAGYTLGLRAGTAAKFENFVITMEGSAIELQTRYGNFWQIMETDDHHNGGIWTGYDGTEDDPSSAHGDRTSAVISNIPTKGAKKVTLSIDMANGWDCRPVNEDGTRGGNMNYGMILNVYNNDEVMPLFWETESGKPSYFYVAFTGASANGSMHGKWGPMTSDYSFLGDGWNGFPNTDGFITETGAPAGFEAEFNFNEYNTLVGIWDAENLHLQSFIDGTEVHNTHFTGKLFKNDGLWAGVRTNSGNVYYNNFDFIVEF